MNRFILLIIVAVLCQFSYGQQTEIASDEAFNYKPTNSIFYLGYKGGMNITSLKITPAPQLPFLNYESITTFNEYLFTILQYTSPLSVQLEMGYENRKSSFSFKDNDTLVTQTFDLGSIAFPLLLRYRLDLTTSSFQSVDAARGYSYLDMLNAKSPYFYLLAGIEFNYIVKSDYAVNIQYNNVVINNQSYYRTHVLDFKDEIRPIQIAWMLGGGFVIPLTESFGIILEGRGAFDLDDITTKNNYFSMNYKFKRSYWQIMAGMIFQVK